MNAGYDTREPMLEFSYLLMQGDRILSVAPSITTIDDSGLDVNASWHIAVGVRNEFGRREIVGIIAEFIARPNSTVYYISSPVDGFDRLIGMTGNSREVLGQRIGLLDSMGKFNDVANLSRVTLREGGTQSVTISPKV